MTSVALTIAVMVTTLFQFGFVSAAARDGTIDEVIPNTNNMGHDIAELNLFYFSTHFVAG